MIKKTAMTVVLKHTVTGELENNLSCLTNEQLAELFTSGFREEFEVEDDQLKVEIVHLDVEFTDWVEH